jgi:hypothetical protein
MDAPKVNLAISGDAASQRLHTRAVVLGLQRRGMSSVQAGNLAALAAGLPPVARGWSVSEIDGLQFARWLVDNGRLGS